MRSESLESAGDVGLSDFAADLSDLHCTKIERITIASISYFHCIWDTPSADALLCPNGVSSTSARRIWRGVA